MPRGEGEGQKKKRGVSKRDRRPIKFDHLLHLDHEISRLMGTETNVGISRVHFKVTEGKRDDVGRRA